MGPTKNINLGAGTLYIRNMDEYEPITEIAEAELDPRTDNFESLNDTIEVLNCECKELSFTATISTDAFAALLGITQSVMEMCPNRRVVHLARYAPRHRTRKKNRHRAFRLLEKEERKK